ncbi:MAG: helix-turn-helix domain-containing protein [Synergistaceae bacterium]|nr:helix-turn-helix domain-containing protein [Synergistaceae bacterium]
MFGEKVRQLRERLNLTQEELAHLVGVHANTISSWENGTIPNMARVIKLANVLNTTTTHLLDEGNDPESLGEIHPLSILAAPGVNDDKRLIVSNRDMYASLPDSPEGFEIMRLFLEMVNGKQAVHQAAVIA